MSKPISFGFGKPKTSTNGSTSVPAPKTSISLPTGLKSQQRITLKTTSALRDEDDDHDEAEPKHEELTGFSSSGAILSKPVEEKKALVIENAGNQDWRRKARGKNLLPDEVQAARNGQDVVMVEKSEVSKASGLQFALSSTADTKEIAPGAAASAQQVDVPRTVDEEALQALINGDDNGPRGNAVIEAAEDLRSAPVDKDDFQALVADHPDSSTLEDYAAMPVEEFGMAMLRGMGKKRRANGEVIQLESEDKKEVKRRKQEGFLGIGAKPAPGMEGIELGAWGKADMRKNNKGQGFFTPVMVRDAATGETITEDELERRKKEGQDGAKDDWRERRDRNLESSGRNRDDKHKESMNGVSRRESDRDSDYDSSRSRSRKHRSRSRSRERRHRNDERYESGSTRRDRDRDRDPNRERYRDKNRDRERYKDDRRHKDGR